MRSSSVKAYVEIDSGPFPVMAVQVSEKSIGNKESLPVSAPFDLPPWDRSRELFLSPLITSCLPDVQYSLM
jgi:hypothetical protein